MGRFTDKETSHRKLVEQLVAAGLDRSDVEPGVSIGLEAWVAASDVAFKKIEELLTDQDQRDIAMGVLANAMINWGEEAIKLLQIMIMLKGGATITFHEGDRNAN